MNVDSVPELVAALGITLLFLVVRTAYRGTHFARLAHAGRLAPARQSGMDEERVRARLIASCVMFALVSMPLILRLVPPNGIYGFRTSATQASRAVWYSANAFMGWALLIAAILSGTLLAVLPVTVKRWLLWATFLVPAFAAIVASFVYLDHLH